LELKITTIEMAERIHDVVGIPVFWLYETKLDTARTVVRAKRPIVLTPGNGHGSFYLTPN
jgi:hypothetical protein